MSGKSQGHKRCRDMVGPERVGVVRKALPNDVLDRSDSPFHLSVRPTIPDSYVAMGDP